jgi:hypothetical protein
VGSCCTTSDKGTDKAVVPALSAHVVFTWAKGHSEGRHSGAVGGGCKVIRRLNGKLPYKAIPYKALNGRPLSGAILIDSNSCLNLCMNTLTI